ncbi:hypothetical protein [Frankia sp. R43]|nr:hypothetical protein [Frankia sp. R43]
MINTFAAAVVAMLATDVSPAAGMIAAGLAFVAVPLLRGRFR